MSTSSGLDETTPGFLRSRVETTARDTRHELAHACPVDRLDSLPLLVDRHPAELLVHDSTEPCPYLPERTARLPLRLPLRPLSGAELDSRFARGDRRHGALFYRPSCPECSACEAIRLDVNLFEPSRTHRRIRRQGLKTLEVIRAEPCVDDERVALYDAHRFGRGLATANATPMTQVGYQRFLVDRFCDAFELQYRLDGQLVGVALTDRSESALSAVYCFYDPAFSRLSIGTFSILEQLAIAQTEGLRHLYLGLYIAGCDAMAYKARFIPHERRIGGEWTPVLEREPAAAPASAPGSDSEP